MDPISSRNLQGFLARVGAGHGKNLTHLRLAAVRHRLEDFPCEV